MKWQRFYLWSLSLIFVLILTACGTSTNQETPKNESAVDSVTTAVTKTSDSSTATQAEKTPTVQAPASPTETAAPIIEKNPNDTVERINTYLNALEQAGFRGAVLVDKGGKVILSAGYGLANDNEGILNTPQTIFDIGSITKQFTGAAILKLQDEGKLSVEDTLATYIPNLPEDKQEITLHQLLTHTAGMPTDLGTDYEATDRDTFIKRMIDTPLLHEPGGEYVYSNAGYSLLAIVIELVTNDTYEKYLHQALFLPAGMEQTGYVLPDWEQANIAMGYQDTQPWGKPNEKTWAADGPYWHLRGNGGLLSSAEDMYRWHQALLTDDILSAAAKEQYFAPHVREGEGVNSFYGYGWALFPTPRDTLLVAHDGGNGIFFANFLRYIEEDVAIYMAVNKMNRGDEDVALNIAQIIFDEDFMPTVRDEANRVDVAISDLANTPAGQTVALLLSTIQEGDDAAINSLVENHYSTELFELVDPEEHLELFKQFQAEIGGSPPDSATENDNEFILTYVDEEGNFLFDVIVTIASDDASIIQDIGVDY